MCPPEPKHLVPACDSLALSPHATAIVEAMPLGEGATRWKQPGSLSYHMENSCPKGVACLSMDMCMHQKYKPFLW